MSEQAQDFLSIEPDGDKFRVAFLTVFTTGQISGKTEVKKSISKEAYEWQEALEIFTMQAKRSFAQ